jgi:hypothetical protein
MGREELIEAIEDRAKEPSTVSADDLDTMNRCTYCEAAMPYEEYNEHDPQMDYVRRILPTEGETSPPQKLLYCSVKCLSKDTDERRKEV